MTTPTGKHHVWEAGLRLGEKVYQSCLKPWCATVRVSYVDPSGRSWKVYYMTSVESGGDDFAGAPHCHKVDRRGVAVRADAVVM